MGRQWGSDGNEDEIDSGLELDPTDPDSPDWDLSEAAPYSAWEPAQSRPILGKWLIIVVSFALVVTMFFPTLYWLIHYLTR